MIYTSDSGIFPEGNIGWGIAIEEGLNWFLITCVVVVLMLFAGVFAVIWSICRQGAIGEGFSVAQYLVAVVAAISVALFTKWTYATVSTSSGR